MLGGEPARAASHGHVDGALEHDADDGVEGVMESSSVRARKFPAALLTSTSSGPLAQICVNELLDIIVVANVAGEGLDGTAGGGGELFSGLLDDELAASADKTVAPS